MLIKGEKMNNPKLFSVHMHTRAHTHVHTHIHTTLYHKLTQMLQFYGLHVSWLQKSVTVE
jgi:hypothetical protein